MAKNPLGKIKDLTKGAASVGLHVAGQATKSATSFTAGAVAKLVQGRKLAVAPAPVAPKAKTPEPAAKPAPTAKPVAKAAPPAKSEATPVTSIDAAAESVRVDVTPADVAKKVARKAPRARRRRRRPPRRPRPAPSSRPARRPTSPSRSTRDSSSSTASP